LLVDSHTSQTFCLKALFLESKIYWDGKNKCYDYKNEVVVIVLASHYYQFVFKNEVGSVHDYQNFKEHFGDYLDYLFKQPKEMHHLQGDLQH
jgi:hypothetical protein